jgi:peroxiredoxin
LRRTHALDDPFAIMRRRIVSAGGIAVALLIALAGCFRASNPIAVLASAVVSGPAPLDVSFNLSYSEHPRGRPMEYTLNFGDGSDTAIGSDLGLAVHHVYDTGGTYVATLTLIDDQGSQGIDRLTITVSQDGPPVGTQVGDTAPDFTAHTTDGGEITLSGFRDSVVLLDFWGEWCGPCRQSMPRLDALLQTYGSEGLVAILISTDPVEQATIDYLADHGYEDFMSVWEPGGKYTPVAQLYGVLSGGSVGIPHTFLIDRQGVIRFRGHPILDLADSMVEGLL